MQALPAQEEWVRVLNNGLITIPKSWRTQTGIKEKDIIKAKLIDNKIILEPVQSHEVRIFTDNEIQQWIEDDKLPKELADETNEFWSDIP